MNSECLICDVNSVLITALSERLALKVMGRRYNNGGLIAMWKECYGFATTVSVAHLFWARSEGNYFHILCPWILLAPEKFNKK